MYANLFKDKEQLYEAIKGLLKSVILKPRPVAVLGDIVAVRGGWMTVICCSGDCGGGWLFKAVGTPYRNRRVCL